MKFDIREYSLQAGVGLEISQVGRYFTVVETTDPITVTARHNGSSVGVAEQGEQGLIVPVLPKGFTSLYVESATTQTVMIAISDDPVTMFRLSGVVNISASQGNTITDPSATSVGATATAIASANSNRRSLRIVNEHSSQIRIGGSGVTASTGIPLEPGDVYIENDGAAAAWYAISTSGTGNVVTQAIT